MKSAILFVIVSFMLAGATAHADVLLVGNSLTVLDWGAGEVARTIDLGEDTRPHGMAFLPDGRLVVTTEGSDHLVVVDIEAGRVVGTTATGAGAEGVGVARGGREVWVTNRADDTVSVIDADSLETLAQLDSAGFPIRVAMTADGQYALVTNARAATLSVFDIERRELAVIDRSSWDIVARWSTGREPDALGIVLTAP